MPCYRCGARQVDPDRGESPWRRGVRAERQVLICPDCQVAFDWTGDLDRCSRCSSVHLVRRLGETECRDCGVVGQPAISQPTVAGDIHGGVADTGAADTVPPDLAAEVEQALARVLGPSRQRPPFAMS
jgi:hypothetical protein